MATTKKLASLAAGLAAGSYTNDYVLEALGGDKSLFDRVLGMASGGIIGSIASDIAEDIIEESPLDDLCDSIDDLFDI